ncbi:MAG TPA: hypothetical protein VKD72_36585 [Gemmataceae bacterium]|nr:hypothetical protein [Gemmataceae bacterium]
MNTPGPTHIRFLFDQLWPEMEYSPVHCDRCLANLDRITEVFRENPDDPEGVLQGLLEIEDIGPVIASGLIFSANRDRFVPFDKYTMGYALELRILSDRRITTGNYGRCSASVVDYVAGHPEVGDIEGFVRAARHTQFPFSPE